MHLNFVSRGDVNEGDEGGGQSLERQTYTSATLDRRLHSFHTTSPPHAAAGLLSDSQNNILSDAGPGNY